MYQYLHQTHSIDHTSAAKIRTLGSNTKPPLMQLLHKWGLKIIHLALAHRYIDLRRITGVHLKIAFLIIVAIAAAGEPFLKNVLP